MPSSPARAPFKAVVFDAYGTLFDVHSVASLAEQLWPGRGDSLSHAWRAKQLEYSWLRTMSGRYKPFWDVTRDALRHAAARLGLPLDAARETRLMNQYASLSAFPENLDALRALKSAGLPLGILTNGNRAMIDVSIRSAGMDGLFDHVLSSEQVEAFKTVDRIYALGPATFGCPARRILFVSSNGWDAVASRWYGYTSFWINRGGLPPEHLDTEPDHTGRLLTDVVAVATARP
ncbi:MAG: haloacid dehalogenase type II [Burkholderiaceae bacterium]|nr:haloacid dehalogenase type II [Burkholderiales bacterium]MCZ8103618.1 haloacid dehalogenase type II [Burkholderiales bacterium]MCZ8337596.1 haloacid dehalogenase type II [Burkholderiaceae bacterium]